MALLSIQGRHPEYSYDPDVDLSSLIYDDPEHFPVSDLYRAVMLTIKVQDDQGHAEEFLIFKVFIAWLYTGRVFFEKGTAQNQDRKRKRKQLETEDLTVLVEAPIAKKPCSSSICADEGVAPDKKAAPEDKLDRGTMRNSNHDFNGLSDCNDSMDPLCWPLQSLFSLYVFTDKYDTRSLRMSVMEIIQLKLLSLRPYAYQSPSVEDIRFACARLPIDCPLLQQLIHFYAKGMTLLSFGRTKREQTEQLGRLPPAFTLQCLMVSKTQSSALWCKRRYHDQCPDHSEDDRSSWPDPCSFHEHGDNEEEREVCHAHWKDLWANFCTEEKNEPNHESERDYHGNY